MKVVRFDLDQSRSLVDDLPGALPPTSGELDCKCFAEDWIEIVS
jgi:hypothetical protein